MRKILVPTDFSSLADNALSYAIEIGGNFSAELLLYHVYTFHRNVDYNWDFPKDQQPFEKNIQKQMNSSKAKFEQKINQKGLVVHTKIKEDQIFALFERVVNEEGIDLIIMGSKGASGLKKIIFGSVAATALEMAKVPLLVIPPNFSFSNVNNILFAFDRQEVSTDDVEPLREIAQKFNAKVTILNVASGKNDNQENSSRIHIENVRTEFKEIPLSESVSVSINEFVAQNNFDMICYIRRRTGLFEGLFKRSVSKSQVYDFDIPLLIIPKV